ncbi:HD domain-containing protein [Streptococcus plurextorum]|uniref:HD domain-containing protein n=1 Tax=Streptococcus plurextorum TaxID=456876 RepID=UPI00040E7E80|nr:HD domain-containing protein [Streptococcus plurextorum]
MPYTNDAEFMSHVGHLIRHPKFRKLDKIVQHKHSTRYEHSINVAYTSFKIARKLGWDAKSTARGGLLHDLFYYDWRDTKFKKGHAWTHPRIAARNAKKLIELNHKEEDIILKHMWGATIAPPRYKESYLVSMVDKYWAVREATRPIRKAWRKRPFLRRKELGSHHH